MYWPVSEFAKEIEGKLSNYHFKEDGKDVNVLHYVTLFCI